MTPAREAYLMKCSKREKELRFNINQAKINLAVFKMAVIKQGMLPILKNSIKSTKCRLVAYRHELHRLKGMDRVAVPRRAEGYIGVFVCKCGSDVIANYCPNCGRRILWDRVMK